MIGAAGERILVISHAHPDFSHGGGELAAHALFKAFRGDPRVEAAWFLARCDRGRGANGAITVRHPGEYLWEQGIGDWHMLKAAHRESMLTRFAELLRTLKPTIIHLHHYMHLGMEVLQAIRRIDPTVRICVTLHEYMAICRNNGQMIKAGGMRLCSRATDDDCRMCFPKQSAEDFWLRRHFIQRHFDLVDGFVAPSRFLRQRYVEWGIAPERITVIENGQADVATLPPRPVGEGGSRNRFGFFGQVNPYKGLDVVLEGLSSLSRKQRRGIVLEVNGANLELQEAPFQARIAALRGPLEDEGVLQWTGAYQPHELAARMAGIDWVVVPSVWWENSPMVIQEAFVHGRPLLVSDIGGMAEKVRNGVDGLHVPAGNRREWAESLVRAAAMTDEWDALRAGIRRPPTHRECADAHLRYFATMGGSSVAGAEACA